MSVKHVLGLLALCTGLWASSLEVSDAYVREVPPGVTNSAAFMMIENLSDQDLSLVAARSDVAENVELHTHKKSEGGMMKMMRVDAIPVAAKSVTGLQPGGYHVMLIGLNRSLKSGDTVELALEFSNGEKLSLSAPVKTVKQGMQKPMRCGSGKCGSGKCGR